MVRGGHGAVFCRYPKALHRPGRDFHPGEINTGVHELSSVLCYSSSQDTCTGLGATWSLRGALPMAERGTTGAWKSLPTQPVVEFCDSVIPSWSSLAWNPSRGGNVSQVSPRAVFEGRAHRLLQPRGCCRSGLSLLLLPTAGDGAIEGKRALHLP